MSGRKRNIYISKDRFTEAIRRNNTSMHKIGILAEQKRIISYRSLQRNLSEGKMSYSVLVELSKILNVSAEYLQGEKAELWQK